MGQQSLFSNKQETVEFLVMFTTFIRSTSQVNHKKEVMPITFYCILTFVKTTITKHISLKQKIYLKDQFKKCTEICFCNLHI